MELQELHMGPERVEDKHRARLRSLRQTLPYQRDVVEDAALQFGLPMTGQEIHERVRRVLPARFGLPLPARIGIGIFAVLSAVFLGVLLPWALSSWLPCQGACPDPFAGFIVSLVGGLVFFGIGGVILAVNIERLTRTSGWTDVEHYAAPIPEAALLKMAEAIDSKLFKAFYVVEPTYEFQAARRQRTDPWLIGRVVDQPPDAGQDSRRGYIVLAYWD